MSTHIELLLHPYNTCMYRYPIVSDGTRLMLLNHLLCPIIPFIALFEFLNPARIKRKGFSTKLLGPGHLSKLFPSQARTKSSLPVEVFVSKQQGKKAGINTTSPRVSKAGPLQNELLSRLSLRLSELKLSVVFELLDVRTGTQKLYA